MKLLNFFWSQNLRKRISFSSRGGLEGMVRKIKRAEEKREHVRVDKSSWLWCHCDGFDVMMSSSVSTECRNKCASSAIYVSWPWNSAVYFVGGECLGIRVNYNLSWIWIMHVILRAEKVTYFSLVKRIRYSCREHLILDRIKEHAVKGSLKNYE